MAEIPFVETMSVDYAFHDFNNEEANQIKERVRKCPVLEFELNNIPVRALVDTGSEISAISLKLLSRLVSEHVPVPTLPTAKCYVIGVGNKRSKPITKQALISFQVQEHLFDVPCLVVEDLKHDLILGVDFLKENDGVIDFSRDIMSFGGGKEITITDDNDGELEPSILCASWNLGDDVSGVICRYGQNNDLINDHERSQLQQLLLKFSNVFARPIHPVKDFCFRINVTDDTPFKIRNYPVPQSLREQVDKTIREMIIDGIIESYSLLKSYSNSEEKRRGSQNLLRCEAHQ